MNKFHYPLDLFWSEEDAGFIAEVRDLPGCSAWGATEAAAVRESRNAIASWIQAAKATGRAVPEPTVGEPVDRFSGKFVVRVPKSLHARLARDASKEGVSLNQFVLSRLAG